MKGIRRKYWTVSDSQNWLFELLQTLQTNFTPNYVGKKEAETPILRTFPLKKEISARRGSNNIIVLKPLQEATFKKLFPNCSQKNS
jgi:hypothetical protein